MTPKLSAAVDESTMAGSAKHVKAASLRARFGITNSSVPVPDYSAVQTTRSRDSIMPHESYVGGSAAVRSSVKFLHPRSQVVGVALRADKPAVDAGWKVYADGKLVV